jgi:hypothetical protein
MLSEHLKILQFGSRWNDVLEALGLERIADEGSGAAGSKGGGGWAGGESEAHKSLKMFVKANPGMFGAATDSEAFDEYALRSGDEIDVFFKSERLWIGVEVKSSVSKDNELDLERGIYQVIKYRAVLEAQARADNAMAPPTVKVFLALECELPSRLVALAKALAVEVREKLR